MVHWISLRNEGIRWCWRLPWSVPAKRSLAAAKAAAEAASYQTAYDALTLREREVFVLAAKGLSNKEAAEVPAARWQKPSKMHKANGLAKLGVQSSLEAYQWLENLPTPQPKDVP